MNGIMRYNGTRWDFFETPGSPMAIHVADDGTIYTALMGDLGYMKRTANGGLTYVSLLAELELDYPPFFDTYSITDVDGHVFFITDSSILHKHNQQWKVYTDTTPFFVSDYSTLMLIQLRDRSLIAPTRPNIEINVRTSEPLRMLNGLFLQNDGSYIAFGAQGQLYRIVDIDDFIEVSDFTSPKFDYLANFVVFDFIRGYNNEYIILTRSDGIYVTDSTGNLMHHFDEASGLRNSFALGAWIDPFKNLWLTGYYGITKVRTGSNSFLIDHRSGIRGEIWDAEIFNGAMFVSTNRGVFKAEFNDGVIGLFSQISSPRTIDSVGEFYVLPHPRDGKSALFFQTPQALFEVLESEIRLVSNHIGNHPFHTPLYPDIFFGSDGFTGFTAIRYKNGEWIASEEDITVFRDALLDVVPVHAYEFMASYFIEGMIRIRFKAPYDDDLDWKTGPFGIEYIIEEIDSSDINEPFNHVSLKSYDDTVLIIARNGFYTLNEDKTEIIPYPIVDDSNEWVYVDYTRDRNGNRWLLRTQTNVLMTQFIANQSEPFRITIPTGSYSIPTTGRFLCCKDMSTVFLHTPERIHAFNVNVDELASLPTLHLFLMQMRSADGSLIDIFSGYDVSKNIRLPYSKNTLSFEVGTNYITASDKNKFQFFLVGADREFSMKSPFNAKEYINLREGNYTLKVRVTNAFGQQAEKSLITFSIAPPYYRSLFAYFLYMIVAIGLIYGGYRYRLQTVTKHNEMLQHLIDERTSELSREKVKLEQVNQIKLRLLKMTAHDLRSPLSAITGYAELINQEDNIDDIKVYANVIHDSSEKMRSIIQSMLASGSRNLEHIDLNMEKLNLNDIISRLVTQFQIHLRNKKQTLEVDILDTLPKFMGDKVRASEIFDNLISNAIKYSPIGSSIFIKARPDKETHSIIVNIIDEGPGFSHDDLSKVFGENQTLSAKTTGNEESTGFGLFITKQLIHAHGGEIIIRNKKTGSGADIVVILPAVKE